MESAGHAVDETVAYLDGAPHLKHPSLRELFRSQVSAALASIDHERPRVLDLGAGEGSATVVFLERGATVTAVDDSASRLEALERRAAGYQGSVELVHGRAEDALLERANERYDLVAAVSFLHHVPDYVALVRDAVGLVAPGGAFMSFQDPLLYERLPRSTYAFQRLAYAAWRVRKRDVIGGLRRRARRARGIWDETCAEDVVEYHATRGGLDERALCTTLRDAGLEPRLLEYFSTQSATFQRLGTALGLVNTFSITARRH